MKKFWMLSSMLLFLTLTNHAQVEIKGLIGANWSTLRGSEQDIAAKMGFQYGAGLLIGNKFYVEPGIQFVTSSSVFNANSTKIDFSQNFVKIPVYAGYHLLGAEDKPIALRIFAGPTASIAGRIKKGPESITKDDINKMIWAVDGGIGLDILFLFVEANYEYSFNDYFANSAVGSGKHGAFIVNAGVHIDF